MVAKNRYQQMRNLSESGMTRFLCKFTEAILDSAGIADVCEYCPATKYCESGHTGFEDWLKEKPYENL